MNCVLRTALILTFVAGLSSVYVSKTLWACGGACGAVNIAVMNRVDMQFRQKEK